MSGISRPKKFTEKETELTISMYVNGKSVADIAKKLNRSEGSIYSKLSREKIQNPHLFEKEKEVTFYRTEKEALSILKDSVDLDMHTNTLLEKHKLNNEEELNNSLDIAKEYIFGKTTYHYGEELYKDIIK